LKRHEPEWPSAGLSGPARVKDVLEENALHAARPVNGGLAAAGQIV
jgi:hypothetical protein